MIMSSSFLVLKVNNVNEKDFKNFNYKKNSGVFSLHFDNEEKSSGNINWNFVIGYGKNNTVRFLRQNEYFLLLTSTTETAKLFKEMMKELTDSKSTTTIVKIPLNSKLNLDKEYEGISNLTVDEIFGVKGKYTGENYASKVSMYTNGLVTYNMTQNESIVRKLAQLTIEISNDCSKC